MSKNCQGTKWRRKIVENFNGLSYGCTTVTDRQTTDRQMDGRQHIASSRSLKSTNGHKQALGLSWVNDRRIFDLDFADIIVLLEI